MISPTAVHNMNNAHKVPLLESLNESETALTNSVIPDSRNLKQDEYLTG